MRAVQGGDSTELSFGLELDAFEFRQRTGLSTDSLAGTYLLEYRVYRESAVAARYLLPDSLRRSNHLTLQLK